MSKMPVISGKDLVHFLHRRGYKVIKIHGSHHYCARQDGKGIPLDIPVHANEEIAKGTLRSIIKVYARNEGVTEEEAKEMIRRA